MQKKEQEQKKQTIVKDFMKILFLMYAVTMILLLLLAFALFKMELTETFSKVWLIAVSIISGVLGGFLIGKRAGAQKFLWGFLMGAVYFLILFGVSVILYKGFPNDLLRLCTTMILCVASGTVGGMVS